jgi:hypothetical protein
MAEGIVNRHGSLPRSADPRRAMPAHAGARRDAIDRAIRVLDDERRRFERLGLDGALGHCREARRFWSFVDALHAIAAEPGASGPWTARMPGRGGRA